MSTIKVTLCGESADEELAQLNTVLVSYWVEKEYREFPDEVEIGYLRHASTDYLLKNNIAAARGYQLHLVLV